MKILVVVGLLVSQLLIASTDNVSVDVTAVLTDVSSKPIGINTDYFVDDDANRAGQRTLAQALSELGVRYLRYPGGEKSDGTLWSVPPYTRPQPTLARWATGEWPQNQEWPSYDRSLVKSDGRTLVKDPLDFDEFMRVVRTINGEPVLVVAYDAMYKPAQANGSAPTHTQLLETAKQWVRYANVTKGYNVKYWEIGNESYLPSYNSNRISPETYAADLIEFSRVMKSVDPSIRIIANGNDSEWWRIVLEQAGPALDLLAVHSYPPYGWGNYDYYRTRNPDLMADVRVAEQAINGYASRTGDSGRIKIAVTEMNSADWTGAWAHDNNLGHAVVLFDALGEQLTDPMIAFSQVWNTRWVTGDTQTSPSLWDVLDKDNHQQAVGQALATWGQFLLDQMVATSSTQMIKTFASYSPLGTLNIFLINKDTSSRPTNVSLAHFAAQADVTRWSIKGSGPDDMHPAVAQPETMTADVDSLSLMLDPVSITVLQLHARVERAPLRVAPLPIPGLIAAKDYDDGDEGVAYHDTTAGNYGGAYRSTDVDIQTSPGAGNDTVGWIDRGEWLSYSVNVAQSADYTVTATVASSYTGKTFHLECDGKDVTGSMTVPNTQGWDRWATVSVAGVNLSAGLHTLRFVADSDSFNVSTFMFDRAAHTASSTRLLFDDFEDGTSANWAPTAGSWRICRPVPNASWEYCGTNTAENVSLAGAASWRDYLVQSYVHLDSDVGSGVAILGRVQDATHFYQAELRRDASGNKVWTLWKNSGGSWTYLSSGYFEYAAGSYYLLRMSMIGTSITVSVSTDWGASFQPLGGGSDTEFLSGRIGLRSWGSPASFDGVEVLSE